MAAQPIYTTEPSTSSPTTGLEAGLKSVFGGGPVTEDNNDLISFAPTFGTTAIGTDPTPTPATRLKIKLANAKAATQDQRRQQDTLIMPTILEDIKKNQDRMNDIAKQIETFNAQLNAPVPQRQVPQLDQADLISLGLTSLFGGPKAGSQGFHALSDAAGQREEVRYGNDVNTYNAKREMLLRQLQELDRSRGQGEQWGQHLEGERIDEMIRQDQATRAQGQFDTNVRLKEADDARQDDREKRLDRENRVKGHNNQVLQLWQTGGEITPEVRKTLESQQAKLIADGVPPEDLFAIPSGKTAKQRDIEADNARADQAQKDKRTEWADRYKFMKQQERDRVADWAARRDIAIAKGNKPERDHATEQLLKEARGARDRHTVELRQVEGQIRQAKSDPDWGGLDRTKKLAELYSKQAGLNSAIGEVDEIVRGYRDAAKQDQREGLPPIADARSDAQEFIRKYPGRAGDVRARFESIYHEKL